MVWSSRSLLAMNRTSSVEAALLAPRVPAKSAMLTGRPFPAAYYLTFCPKSQTGRGSGVGGVSGGGEGAEKGNEPFGRAPFPPHDLPGRRVGLPAVEVLTVEDRH